MRYTCPTADVLAVVKARAGGSCLRGCGRRGEQCHHRIPRGMGGTRNPKVNQPPNLVWICSRCHQQIESRRADAYDSGWLVRRTADPESQPLVTLNQQMLMLQLDGGMVINSLVGISDPTPF